MPRGKRIQLSANWGGSAIDEVYEVSGSNGSTKGGSPSSHVEMRFQLSGHVFPRRR